MREDVGSPGAYYVGMNVGLIARLYRVAYALMSMRDLFPAFGNADQESASDVEVAACLFAEADKSPQFQARGDSPLPSAVFADVRPKSIDRHVLAHAMVGVGLQWFYYHEFRLSVRKHKRRLPVPVSASRAPRCGYLESRPIVFG